MELAPIVLFVYNRPEHTRRTIKALQRNALAEKSELIVFADGPRCTEDRYKVNEVREYLQCISGFRRVFLRESETNRGLASSIIEGVTEVIKESGRAIILEDDLVVAPYFLDYMNSALEYYADQEQVMHISSYWWPVEQPLAPETFFLRVPSSWGWATWSRAWRYFDKSPINLLDSFSREEIRQFNLDGANDFWEQVVHNCKGKADTWAIFWYATIFRNKGLCLYPSRSLTHNVGLDGSGVHCLKTAKYGVELRPSRIEKFSDDLEEDALALSMLKDFYRKNRIGRLRRFIVIICQRFGLTLES